MEIIDMKELVIIGAGDVGKYIAYHFSNLTEFNIIGFLDDNKSKWGKSYANLPVLGDWTYLKESKELSVVIGIADPNSKQKIWNNIKDIKGLSFPNLIHPKCWIGENVNFGIGNVVYPGVSINYETEIMNFVTINMNCSIGHNCKINDFNTLSPGINFGGFTEIGKTSFIGIGTNTIQSIKIGNQCTIGGGTMIIKDIPDGCTVVGNPGKIIKSIQK
jgi:sugar O-acyltransferase (sialic acid O-acetyltransferase NeuD family)